MKKDQSMSSSPDQLTLPQLLKLAQSAAQAVEQAEEVLTAAKREHAQALAAATATRNTAMNAAEATRREAEQVFREAVQRAGAAHDATVEEANTRLAVARSAHLSACEGADPILREVQARSTRIANIISRSG